MESTQGKTVPAGEGKVLETELEFVEEDELSGEPVWSTFSPAKP